ncbi:MAG: DegT/DnrJ/EryC1/StrS family aminotransferase [Arenicellales bacterium]
MTKTIRWYEPVFGEEEKRLVCDVLDGGYVNQGPRTRELEQRLSTYLGVRHVVLTTSGTAALFLAMEADKRVRGLTDFEVLVPDLAFFPAATVVELAGGRPVLVDVESHAFTIDTEAAERKLTSRTRAIIPVQLLGRASDMAALDTMARAHDLTIIEDAAACLGSMHEQRPLGTFGKTGCFSLQANKIISTGQGGFVVTNDDSYFEKMVRIRDFGRLDNRERLHEETGYNLKFNDILAAVGLVQLDRLEKRKSLLRAQWQRYADELAGVPQVRFPTASLGSGTVPIYVDVLVSDRSNLVSFLRSCDIHPREYWEPLHRNRPYRNLGDDEDFPMSTYVADHGLWLPNGPAVDLSDVSAVCGKIKEYYSLSSSSSESATSF